MIDRRAKDVASTDALEYVAGVMALNDITACDAQHATSQGTAGKVIDTFAPCRPNLVLLDEIEDIQSLRIRARVNDMTVQEGNTENMICGVAATIEFLSGLMTLETPRAAVNLVRRGVTMRLSGIRLVLPHGGGYLPYGAFRFARLHETDGVGPGSAEAFITEYQKFYFDTALASSAVALSALLRVAHPQRILFGTDTAYAPAGVNAAFTNALDEYCRDSEAIVEAIQRGNAVRLLSKSTLS